MRPISTLLLLAVLGACSRSVQVGSGAAPAIRADDIATAGQLVSAMHARYAGKWYRNITFVQTSTYLRPDGTPSRTELWYEAGEMPGKLRIDLGDIAKGNGVLYRADSVYQVQGGRITHRAAGGNPLMTLGFDVYAQPPSSTLAHLRRERIDTAIMHRSNWKGRPVFVVGAASGDTTTNQFWVDAERLLFVRLIQTNPQNRRTQDIRFEKYVPHAGGWVAERVEFVADGRLVFLEEYKDVRVNVALDSALFIPSRWSTAKHWYQPP
jgi:hypothetical protein